MPRRGPLPLLHGDGDDGEGHLRRRRSSPSPRRLTRRRDRGGAAGRRASPSRRRRRSLSPPAAYAQAGGRSIRTDRSSSRSHGFLTFFLLNIFYLNGLIDFTVKIKFSFIYILI
jgi:hypothetical protein